VSRETVETIDHTVYFSDDNWATIFKRRPHRGTVWRVTSKAEADRVRFLAIAQSTSEGGRS
jgi:hypothetical protein